MEREDAVLGSGVGVSALDGAQYCMIGLGTLDLSRRRSR